MKYVQEYFLIQSTKKIRFLQRLTLALLRYSTYRNFDITIYQYIEMRISIPPAHFFLLSLPRAADRVLPAEGRQSPLEQSGLR